MQIIRPSLEELKEFITLFPLFEQLSSELTTEIHTSPDKVFEMLTPPYYWSEIYEFSFIEHAIIVLYLSGHLSEFSDLAQKDHPYSEIITHAKSSNPEIFPEVEDDPKYVIGGMMALSKSIQSVHHYGIPLNNQVQRVKEGSDQALFDAVRIDRSIISNPTIADRITTAELLSETEFFESLKLSLNGPKKNRYKVYGPLRYMLLLLDEAGMLDEMTDVEQYRLLQEELHLYNPTSTPHTLDTFIRRWREETST